MNPQKLYLWLIWAGMLAFVLIAPSFLPGGEPEESASLESVHLALLIVPLTVATVLRWVVLPKARTLEAVTPAFVIGVGISQLLMTFGVVFAADHQDIFLIAALVGIFQYIPLGIKDPALKRDTFELSE